MLEKLKVGGKGDDRGWDAWMASLTWWTWVWVTSGSWWWTGKPGMLQSKGLQRVRHDWAELTELITSWCRQAWPPECDSGWVTDSMYLATTFFFFLIWISSQYLKLKACKNFWPLLRTVKDLAKLSIHSSTATSAKNRAEADSFMWYTGSPQWISGFQASTVHTWHTPLTYTSWFLLSLVFNLYLVPSTEQVWNMSLGTAPIPIQGEQGSQQRITNNKIYFTTFSGGIHTYRQIHFATWVIFSLTLKKNKRTVRKIKVWN